MSAAPPGYRIRLATPADAESLARIEKEAGELFRTVGLDVVADGFYPPPEAYLDAIVQARAWIAEALDGTPAGLALAGTLDGDAHLMELDVHPDHTRRGLGRALVAAVVDWAVALGLPGIVLTTFRDVPFNGPFYRSLGFEAFTPGPDRPGLSSARAHEAEIGFDLASPRLAMRMALQPRPPASSET